MRMRQPHHLLVRLQHLRVGLCQLLAQMLNGMSLLVDCIKRFHEHDALLGRMLGLAPRLMRELGVTGGFRTVINTGPDGGQEVYHLHMHVMGGPRPWTKG